MQLIDSLKSTEDDVYKLIFAGKDTPLEVAFIRKQDGKDILVLPTQTHCNMGCRFCHLRPGDIPTINLTDDQIVELVEDSLKFSPPQNPTLLVSFMGNGEPLLNVDGLISSAQKLSKISGYQKIRFAVSTLIPGKKPFLDFMEHVKENGLDFKLHWSLHSVKVPVRKNLMPAALDLFEGSKLITQYHETTNRPVEIHYTLIDHINDTMEDAEGISNLIDKRFTIKLLRFAPLKSEPNFAMSNNVILFKNKLEEFGFNVEVYAPPGNSVSASCGMFISDKYIK